MTARKITVYTLSGIVILMVFLSFYFFLRKPEKIMPPKMGEEEKRMIVIRDAIYSSEKKGKIDIRLKAKVAKKYMDRSEVEVEGIEGTYVSKKDEKIFFTGEKGVVDTEKQKAFVYGFSTLIGDEYEVRAESVSFDLKSGFAFGEDSVYIKGQKLNMRGTGIKGELKEGRFTLLKDVSGSISINGEKYRFEASTFTYDRAREMYALSGNVKVDKPDMKITCESMNIYGKSGELRRVEASGNTEMESKGTIAKSEKAVYDFNEKRLVFTGRAFIKRDDMELKGERIEYYMDEGRFESSSPRMKIIRN